MEKPWFSTFGHHRRAAITLFCFPYAGGGASVFSRWQEYLPDHVRVVAFQPPGRAERLREAHSQCLLELADQAAAVIAASQETPYFLFGHSLGARLAFEVAVRLTEKAANTQNSLLPPQGLMVSGSAAPSLKASHPPVHEWPDAELVDYLRSLGGTPEAVFQHPELLKLCLPILRADFALLAHYGGSHSTLDIPAHIFYGQQDERVTEASVLAWRQHFYHRPTMHSMEGGHFFIESHAPAFFARLTPLLCTNPRVNIPCVVS